MNDKPKSLTHLPQLAFAAAVLSLASVICLCIPAGFADQAQEPAGTDTAAVPSQETASESEQSVTGQPGDELLTQVRTKLEGLDSLACELHQTALIAGMKLTAVGRYTEAAGNRVHLRYVIFPLVNARADDVKALEFDTEVTPADEADNRGILTQISDGSILYTSWKNGENQKVTRRNIRDILAAASATATYDPQHAAMDLGIGGLRGLISRIQVAMDFAPAKTVKVGDKEFLEVTGRWNKRIRTDVLKLPEDTVTIPQPHLPEYVRLYVDAQTLLPRRIQYLKRSLNVTQNLVRPMITLDLRNLVVNGTVDESLFVFHAPENTPEEDLTEQVIQAIQQAGKPTPAPESTPNPASTTSAPATSGSDAAPGAKQPATPAKKE